MEEEGKKKFKVLTRQGKNGVLENQIFIDDELLDWSADLSSIIDAKKMGPLYFRAALKDMERHFVECVSQVLGRKVTYQQVLDATKSGWI